MTTPNKTDSENTYASAFRFMGRLALAIFAAIWDAIGNGVSRLWKKPACGDCGSTVDVVNYTGHNVCRKCWYKNMGPPY